MCFGRDPWFIYVAMHMYAHTLKPCQIGHEHRSRTLFEKKMLALPIYRHDEITLMHIHVVLIPQASHEDE